MYPVLSIRLRNSDEDGNSSASVVLPPLKFFQHMLSDFEFSTATLEGVTLMIYVPIYRIFSLPLFRSSVKVIFVDD